MNYQIPPKLIVTSQSILEANTDQKMLKNAILGENLEFWKLVMPFSAFSQTVHNYKKSRLVLTGKNNDEKGKKSTKIILKTKKHALQSKKG